MTETRPLASQPPAVGAATRAAALALTDQATSLLHPAHADPTPEELAEAGHLLRTAADLVAPVSPPGPVLRASDPQDLSVGTPAPSAEHVPGHGARRRGGPWPAPADDPADDRGVDSGPGSGADLGRPTPLDVERALRRRRTGAREMR